MHATVEMHRQTGVHSAMIDRVQTSTETGTQALRLGVTIAALGVVFGDIGTSPIYTIQTVFNPGDPHPVPISDGQRVRRRVD